MIRECRTQRGSQGADGFGIKGVGLPRHIGRIFGDDPAERLRPAERRGPHLRPVLPVETRIACSDLGERLQQHVDAGLLQRIAELDGASISPQDRAQHTGTLLRTLGVAREPE